MKKFLIMSFLLLATVNFAMAQKKYAEIKFENTTYDFGKSSHIFITSLFFWASARKRRPDLDTVVLSISKTAIISSVLTTTSLPICKNNQTALNHKNL